MMRQELFEAVKASLAAQVPEVKHVDLWNHNVEFIEQEDVRERPAVFVEIESIAWSQFQGGGHRVKGLVSVHVVTDWNEGGQEATWGLCGKMYDALEGLF